MILFKKQLFDLEVKGQGPTKVITVWDTPPYGHVPIYMYQISLTYLERQLEAQHWTEPVSLTFHSALRKLNTELSIGACHQISAHFGQAVSEEKIFRNRPI
jgi:hypothetical protein